MKDFDSDVRPGRLSDVDHVVDVHLASFEGFFLSSLGRRFLRLFYLGLIEQHDGILLVAVSGGRVVGFVGGATEQVKFYSRLMRDRFWSFVVAATVAALRRPRALGRLIRAQRRARGMSDSPPGAWLMTVGVLPEVEGRGVGRELVSSFIKRVEAADVGELRLTTDAVDNERVNIFYLSLGFRRSGERLTPEGRLLNEYVLTLSSGDWPHGRGR